MRVLIIEPDFVGNSGALPACALPPSVGATLTPLRDDSRRHLEQRC